MCKVRVTSEDEKSKTTSHYPFFGTGVRKRRRTYRRREAQSGEGTKKLI